MSFLAPAALLGLLGALLPLVIHLLYQKRPRRLRFAAMTLLQRSLERIRRRVRLERYLLLLARMLIIAGLSIAAAEPIWGEPPEAESDASIPESIALVIDASLSTRATYRGESSFRRELAAARDRVRKMRPGDRMTLILAGLETQRLFDKPIADQAQLLARIDELKPSYAYANLSEAITRAAEALSEDAPDEERERRVVLLSDLQQSAFSGPSKLYLPNAKGAVRLELVESLGVGGQMENLAVTQLIESQQPSRDPQSRQFRARVRSYAPKEGSQAKKRALTLWVEGQAVLETQVDVMPQTLVDKSFSHRFFGSGSQAIFVELEDDVLAEDNRRHHLLSVARKVQVLIVDGAPSGLPKADEVYYLERALAVGVSDQPPARVVTVDELGNTDLSLYQVVILAGVPSLGRAESQALVRFVEAGGGLFISASSDVDPANYNERLGALLPLPIQGLRDLEHQTKRRMGFREPQLEHPILRAFRGEGLGGLRSTRTHSYLALRASELPSENVLLRYDNGDPALLLRTHGLGRVALLTTSLDRDLTDLPIRPAFVPLMRRSLLYLGRGLTDTENQASLVGQHRELPWPAGATRMRIHGPRGEPEVFHRPTRSDLLSYGPIEEPGFYRVEAELDAAWKPVAETSFAANIDTRESDLRPIASPDLYRLLGGHSESGALKLTEGGQGLVGLGSASSLATWFLGLMFVAFLTEAWLTARRA